MKDNLKGHEARDVCCHKQEDEEEKEKRKEDKKKPLRASIVFDD